MLRLDDKAIVDVGSGPISALEFLPEAAIKFAIDPLADEYERVYPERDRTIEWIKAEAESLPITRNFAGLVLCMNALDHFERPLEALIEMNRILRPGGYIAVHCCENNAINNPHPAHKHNVTYTWFRSWADSLFECVVSRKVRYGWRIWRGKVGQPAFAYLGRKTMGYGREVDKVLENIKKGGGD